MAKDIKEVISEMVANGESDEMIQSVVDAYNLKKKGNSETPSNDLEEAGSQDGTPSSENGIVEDKLSEQYNPFAQTVNQETKQETTEAPPSEMELQQEFAKDENPFKEIIPAELKKQATVQKVAPEGDKAKALLRGFNSGAAKLGAAVLRTPETIYDLAAWGYNGLLELQNMVMPESLQTDARVKYSDELSDDLGIDNVPAEYLEAYAKVRDDLNEKYRAPIVESVQNGDYDKALYNVALSGAESIPFLLSMFIPSAAGVKASKMFAGTTAVMTSQQKQELADRDDLTESQKNTNALIYGVAESFEVMLGAGSAGRVFRDIVQKEGKKSAIKRGQEMVANFIQESPVMQPFSEGLQEGMTQYVQNLADIYVNGEEKSAYEGVPDAVVMGVAFGTGMGGVNAAAKYMSSDKQKKQEGLSEIAKDQTAIGAAKKLIQAQAEEGTITHEEAEHHIAELDAEVEAELQVPDIIQGDKRIKAIQLQKRYNSLKSQQKNANDAWKHIYNDQIENIENQLKELSNTQDETGQDTGGGTSTPTEQAQGETETQETKTTEAEQGTSKEEVNLQPPQDENKAPEKTATEPRVLSTPTDEQYAVVNRNDGKGEVYLTKEEYESETGFEPEGETNYPEAVEKATTERDLDRLLDNATKEDKVTPELLEQISKKRDEVGNVEVLPDEEAELMGMFGEEQEVVESVESEPLENNTNFTEQTDQDGTEKSSQNIDLGATQESLPQSSGVGQEPTSDRGRNPNQEGVGSKASKRPKVEPAFRGRGKTPLDKRKVNNKEIDKALTKVEPKDIQDHVMQWFAGGGKLNTKAITSFFKKGSERERKARVLLIRRPENGGRSRTEAAHEIWESLPDELRESYSDLDVLNTLEDILLNYHSSEKIAEALNAKYPTESMEEEGKIHNESGEEVFETPHGFMTQEQIEEFTKWKEESETELTDEFNSKELIDEYYNRLTDEEKARLADEEIDLQQMFDEIQAEEAVRETVDEALKSPSPAGSKEESKTVHDKKYFDDQIIALTQAHKDKKASKAKAIRERLRKAKGDTIDQEQFDGYLKQIDDRVDVILTALDKAIDATDTKGKAYDASLGIPMAIAHESLKAVREAYKAGKSVAEAIKAGLKWLKDNNHKVDEKAYAKFVEDQISAPRMDENLLSKAEQGINNLISKGNTPLQAIKKAGLILEKNGKIEDRQEFEKQMKERMGVVPPVTKSSIKKEGKEFAKKEKEVEKQAEKETEERLSGIKNELIPEEKRESYDLNKRTFQDLVDNAKALIKSKAVNPRLMLKNFATTQQTITPEETAIMVVYKTTLDNKRDALIEAIEKDGDLSNERLLLADVNDQIEMFHEMQRKTGYEAGLGLAARKMMMNSEYDLANQVRVFKAITGRTTVPPEVMQKFEQLDKDFRAAKKRIEELDAELTKAKAKIEVLSVERQQNIKERGKKAADLIRKAKFTQTMADLAKLQSDPLGLFKGAWDGVVETIATTLEVTTSIAQVVDAGFKKFKESDWYKNLSEKGKREADKLMRKGVYEQTSSMMGIPLPEMDENGNLFIPDGFVKELIRDGFDTIEKATTEARKRIKENNLLGEDVTERQVRDAISNYGKRSQLSKDETDKKLREFKRVGKLLSALEDVKKKKRPLRSGRERDELIQEERLLRQQINELLKDIPLTSAEQESNWKSALDAYKKRLENRKEDLQKQIDEEKRTRKVKKSLKLDPRAEELKAEVEALEAILESIDSKSNLTYEQKVGIIENALIKSIEDEKKRIKNKDFAPLQQPKITSPKIEKLRAERKKLTEQKNKLHEQTKEWRQSKIDKEVAKIEEKIKDIDKQIAQKKIETTKKNYLPELGAQIKAAKERLKAKRELLKETEAYKEHAEKASQEKLKQHIKKEIKRYQERIKNKDFAVRKSAEQKLNEENKQLHKTLTKIREGYELEKEKERLRNRSNFEKFADQAVNVIGIPRAMMAALDFSAPLRQGFILSTRNPRAAAKAFKEMFKQAFSAERNEAWMADLKETEAYHKMKQMGLYISDVNASLLDKEEAFTSNYAERIGTVKINGKRYGYGSLIKGSNRAYSAYLNVLRVQVYQSFAERMYDRGMTESSNSRVFKEMATFVNNATGRGSLYQLEGAEKLLNGVFFAPRYVSSRFNIVGNTLTGFATYSAPVRREAQKTMLAYIGTTMTMLALAAAMGADVEDDPRSSDFGKIRVGNTRYDIGAGHLQVVRFLASTVLYLGNRFNAWDVPEMKSSTTGGTYYLNQNRPYSTSIGDVWLKFGRSKAAPLTGTIMDFMAADKEYPNEGNLFMNKVHFQNIVGEEMTIGDKTLSLVSPMFLQDMIEIYRQEGVGKGLGSTFPALFGVGVMNYGYKEESTSTPKVQMVSDL